MKQKKAKLYIPIPKEKFLGVEYKQVRVTLVNANKIEELEPILPCEEALSIYICRFKNCLFKKIRIINLSLWNYI